MASEADSVRPADVAAFGRFRLHLSRRRLMHGETEVVLGGRSMDILLALARQQGDLVAKEQLLAAAWPTTFVHEGNLKVAVASLRRALRDHDPSHQFVKTLVGRGYWLDAEGPVVEAFGERERPSDTEGSDPSRLIGRESEVADLLDALARHRLVTIAGPGGIGKTTLALAATRRFETSGGDPVTFVDLARVASGEFVTSSLAAALGISSDTSDSLQAIVSILARRKVVLLLDTCEHVLNAVAHVCDVILAKTANVRIVATSRQVLRAPHERVIWLAPLQVPPDEQARTAAEVLRFPAAQLLALRAAENVGYRFEDRDASAIAAICRRLDGAPLALELVSSRLAGRTAAQVLGELDDRFRHLRREVAEGPLRQQTLLVTLEWSYALLTASEAAVLRAVSIFAGAFDVDGAVRVAARSGVAAPDVLDALTGLKTKSMVSIDHDPGALRYRLLDTTRLFARDLLASRGESDAVSAEHARLLVEMVGRASVDLASLPGRERHDVYHNLSDDLRKAIGWALHAEKDLLLGVRLVAVALPIWHDLSMGEECRTNCERALLELDRIDSTDKALKLKLVVGLATVTPYLAGDPKRTAALFEAAVRLAREIGDPVAECRALAALTTYRLLPGQGAILEALEEVRSAAVRSNDRFAIWEEQQLRAQWEIRLCDFAAAHARLIRLADEMRSDLEGATPRFQIIQRLNVETQLCAVHWLVGQPSKARALAHRVAADAASNPHGLTLIHCMAHGVVWTLMQCRDLDMLRQCVETFTDAVYRHGMAAWVTVAHHYQAAVGAMTGEDPQPERLRSIFEDLKQGMAQLRHEARYTVLAQSMLAAGQFADTARVVDHIFSVNPEPWGKCELLRLRAATLRASGHDQAAEETLRQSLTASAAIGGLGWELRAARDLARLLIDRGERVAARQVLAPVLAKFREGFETGDLKDVVELMDGLEDAKPD